MQGGCSHIFRFRIFSVPNVLDPNRVLEISKDFQSRVGYYFQETLLMPWSLRYVAVACRMLQPQCCVAPSHLERVEPTTLRVTVINRVFPTRPGRLNYKCYQGRSQDFCKGGGLKLWKQKLWKGKIACHKNSQESTYIVEKQLTVLTTKPEVLPTKLPSCFSDSFMTTVKLDHLDYMSQPSFALIYDFFSTVGKHISHVHVSFIFAKFKKRIKLLCANWWYWRVWRDFNLLSPISNFCELILPTCQGP